MFACGCDIPAKQRQIVPDSREIPSNEMVDILYELHLVDGMVALRMIEIGGHTTLESGYTTDSLLYESVFKKHNITREYFEETLQWYFQNHSDTLNVIYDRVITRINMEKTDYEKASMEQND